MTYCSVASTIGVDGEIIPNSLPKKYIRQSIHPCYVCLCADTNAEMGSERRQAESRMLARAYAGPRKQGYKSRDMGGFQGGVGNNFNGQHGGQALVLYKGADRTENPLSWALKDPGVIGDKSRSSNSSKSSHGNSAGGNGANDQHNPDYNRSMSIGNTNHHNLREIYGPPPACAVPRMNSTSDNKSMAAGPDVFSTPAPRNTNNMQFNSNGFESPHPTLTRSAPQVNRFHGAPNGPTQSLNAGLAVATDSRHRSSASYGYTLWCASGGQFLPPEPRQT